MHFPELSETISPAIDDLIDPESVTKVWHLNDYR